MELMTENQKLRATIKQLQMNHDLQQFGQRQMDTVAQDLQQVVEQVNRLAAAQEQDTSGSRTHTLQTLIAHQAVLESRIETLLAQVASVPGDHATAIVLKSDGTDTSVSGFVST
jgi:hypothetical protein